MLVFVGHGISVVGRKLGAWLDRQTVVRMKDAPMPNSEDWGTRTDYICARHDMWIDPPKPGVVYWRFRPAPGVAGDHIWQADYERWCEWWSKYSDRKPTHGLCAVMCAVQFLKPERIAVIGYDSIMNPHKVMQAKWNRGMTPWQHDQSAEARAIRDLVPDIINLEHADHSKLS